MALSAKQIPMLGLLITLVSACLFSVCNVIVKQSQVELAIRLIKPFSSLIFEVNTLVQVDPKANSCFRTLTHSPLRSIGF